MVYCVQFLRVTPGPVMSNPPTAVDAPATAVHPFSQMAGTHGFLRIMNRPAQWVVIITLLISWSIAGVVMFDFVSDDQIASKFKIIFTVTTLFIGLLVLLFDLLSLL